MDLRNKNIVLIIKSPVLGGAERQAIGFAKYAKYQLNCNVTFIATHSGEISTEFKEFLKEIEIDKISYYGKFVLKIDNNLTINNLKNIIKTIRYLIKMIYEIRKRKPYILIPFLNPPSKLAVLVYKFTGAKYTFWHQLGLDYFTHDLIEKYTIRKTPVFIANAENGIDLITNDYDVPRSKLFCLPQYVSIEKQVLDKSDIKKEFEINENDLVIGMVSHYRKEKLFELLLTVFNKLQHKKQLHLVLLGDKYNGKESLEIFEKLTLWIAENQLENKVSLLSNIPLEKVLNILDIGVLVSEIEGTPNVVLEYMLYGIPVIATNHIGCKKLLKNSDVLVENNQGDLLSKLEFLINDPFKRKEIGTQNEKEIEKYSKETYFKNLTIILDS